MSPEPLLLSVGYVTCVSTFDLRGKFSQYRSPGSHKNNKPQAFHFTRLSKEGNMEKKSTNSPTTSNELIPYLENMGKENPVLIELEMTTRAFRSTFCRMAALHDNMKK